MIVVPEFGFFASPLVALLSRRHEFRGRRYACTHADGSALASALLKLHEDNASTLTPTAVRALLLLAPAGRRAGLRRLPRADEAGAVQAARPAAAGPLPRAAIA